MRKGKYKNIIKRNPYRGWDAESKRGTQATPSSATASMQEVLNAPQDECVVMVARCDFCGLTEPELSEGCVIVASPHNGDLRLARTHICEDCVRICAEKIEKMKVAKELA